MFFNPPAQYGSIGDKYIVADELYFPAESFRHQFPATPVFFRHGVLQCDDWVLIQPQRQIINKFLRGHFPVFRTQPVLSIAVKSGTRGIQSQHDIFPRFKAGGCDRFQDDLDGCCI